jgi:hypothetical protein
LTAELPVPSEQMTMFLNAFASRDESLISRPPCTTLHPGASIGSDQQSLHDTAQLPEQSARAREDRPQHSRHGEDVLPVRHGRKNVFLVNQATGFPR